MSAINLELPDHLRNQVANAALRCGVSESEWLAEAAREKLAADSQMMNLIGRAARASRAEYESVLNRVPAVGPEPGDEREHSDPGSNDIPGPTP